MNATTVYGSGKAFTVLMISLFLFIPFPVADGTGWDKLFHPVLNVSISSSIPGDTVHVRCISSEGDVRDGYLASNDSSSEGAKVFHFDVALKLLDNVRYNCLVKQKEREIGQFLGFLSGFCIRGCQWDLHPTYAQRWSRMRQDWVRYYYKPIGSPDDDDYDV
ncbi:hypothetical protein L6164_001743 [Bauhinia variegata]|uniref:Uncharacterized protein n=1 Tax=Bauhinia variegata TaxID=167791 RepID=A0ACB9QBX1_BAUVA|nr:hypothetical protein L6164_001743 [Bauhinia variegata]